MLIVDLPVDDVLSEGGNEVRPVVPVLCNIFSTYSTALQA
jgi:hypothetical protein